MSFSTETELAYAAGVFDGEGHIQIRQRFNKKGTCYHTLGLTMANTNEEVVDWFLERFHGSKSFDNRTLRNDRHKPMWMWKCNSLTAEAVLRAISPYMIIKREQAQIALALRDTFQVDKPWAPLEPGVAERREELRLRLCALTKRGPA